MNVVNLRASEARSRELCGGKGAELARLIHDGMQVPEGFVVTTEAFSSFLAEQGLSPLRSELESLASEPSLELAERLRRGVVAAAFHPALEREVSNHLASLGAGNGQPALWAVRSSGIAEDTDSASFAGQYDTTLGVSAAQVPAAIRHSWSSAFSERAVQYRREHGATEDRMAVVVQALLQPDSAGVCFTVDPISGEHRIVINANYGLGESVVGGYATPDTYHLDPGTLALISQVAGSKETQVVVGASGVQTTEVSAAKQKALCLSPTQLKAVATLAIAVEKRHGKPVDIEWAFENGSLFLLQARPVTVTASATAEPPEGWTPANNTSTLARHPLYSNGNISEVMPGCVTPLSWDHTGRLIAHAFRSQLEALGAMRPEDTEANVLGFFFHRPYVNVSLLLDAAERTPGMTPDTVLEEFVGKPERVTPAVTGADFLPHRLPRLWRVVWAVLRHAKSLPGQIERCQRIADADAAQVTSSWLAEASDEALLEHVRMSTDLGAPSVVHVWASTLASVAFAQLRRRTANWLGDEGGALASELVTGIEGLPSTEPAIALHALSEKIARSEDLANRFKDDTDDEAVLGALRRSVLCDELDDYLQRFGHRGVAEAELSRPCWREDPAQLVSLIHNNLRSGAITPVDIHERQRRAHERALSQLQALSWWKRKWLALLIARARTGFLQREVMKDLVIRRLDRSRLVYRELNRRLTARGLTAAPDDIFFLLWTEVKALADGTRSEADIAQVIEARRRDYRWSMQVEVPKLQEGEPRVLDVMGASDGLDLEGMGVSPGKVTGVARVVTDPRNGARLEPGEILIAPVTDVAWTPLFAQAGGLVVEVGGLLSHGSIVAREYGLPAVVGVAGATRTIRTGDRIAVDGSTGRVVRLNATENQ